MTIYYVQINCSGAEQPKFSRLRDNNNNNNNNNNLAFI